MAPGYCPSIFPVASSASDVHAAMSPEASITGSAGAGLVIVQVALAGVGSMFPAASIAFTWNVCDPAPRLRYVMGDEQLAKAPASSVHWNVEPLSVEVKLKLAVVLVVAPEGPLVIVVSGGVVSGGPPASERPSTSKLELEGVPCWYAKSSSEPPLCFVVYVTVGNCCQAIVAVTQAFA